MRKVRLWTIRSKKKFKSDKKWGFVFNSVLRVNAHFATPYHWLSKQMRKRIGPPTRRVIATPVWAWMEKPDIRRERHQCRPVTQVRIEFEMPRDQILISDFDKWHMPLNTSYAGRDYCRFWKELEEKKLYQIPHEQKPWKYRLKIEKSWENIFKVARGGTRQVTMWEIPLENIIEVTEFKGCSKAKFSS